MEIKKKFKNTQTLSSLSFGSVFYYINDPEKEPHLWVRINDNSFYAVKLSWRGQTKYKHYTMAEVNFVEVVKVKATLEVEYD